jgi:hypothetical protein
MFSALRAFSREDREALAVLVVVSALALAGLLLGAFLTDSPVRWILVGIAVVTTAGSGWLGYYGIFGTHRLRLGLHDTVEALREAKELADDLYDTTDAVQRTVDEIASTLNESGHRISGYRHPADE